MKPPPRKRSKPRNLSPVPEPRRPTGHVKEATNLDRAEQKRLLMGLKRLDRTTGGNQDIDYDLLKKSVPSRSVSEIQAVVESLRNKVISCAASKLKRDTYEAKKSQKPIEVWTHLASALAGTHEESISAAFSQMLIVSSTEPRSLRNCDPPKVYRPAGRTTPFRPVQGQHPGTNTTQHVHIGKTKAGRAPNSKIPGTSPAATSTSLSAAPTSPLSSPATGLPPVPITASFSAASSCSATSSGSTPAAAVQLRHTSKSVTQDSDSVESVDFEKLYRYLGLIHRPNNETQLTPMESAILLDLLMSLQEELPHLDCNKLHKHLIQVHQQLSSPADSKAATELFKDLKNGLCAQRVAQTGPDSTTQQNTAGTADDSDVTVKLQPDEAESQSSKNNNTLAQSEDEDVTGLCPPLNPFMIPLKLLMRRDTH
ncbi:snRNA-activating protein complex subunit 2 [Nibea albiflora]|uniref:snRNA-activating protein complex subunit 2 n=1 Tax=Nibea albiflora TaxID=240163 RepID=A0ACB7EX90_NIBAL|nr:snRNA-activating protein complex subunit 2 [Nibea albiflora]